MEPVRRFSFLRLSSLAPVAPITGLTREESAKKITAEQLDNTLQLLFFAAEGQVDGVRAILDKEVDVDSSDFDKRTALHVAACENKIEVVNLLLERGANVNVEDRWGSTPLADARHYGNLEISRLLEGRGGKLLNGSKNSLVRTQSSIVPEYEIEEASLEFSTSPSGKKAHKYREAVWNGTKVWVYFLLGTSISMDEQLLGRFREQLALLLKLRHPNVVQFLGAVTQTSPMMIVTEFLPEGDLKQYLMKNKRLEVSKALSFALDVARGLNCLHEHKPESIFHGELKPSNLLITGGSKHIKVANFGLSRFLKEETSETMSEGAGPLKPEGSFRRYMAPEFTKAPSSVDKSVDTFAFGIILQEMLEGHPPFPEIKDDAAVAKAYVAGSRPPFRHSGRRYPLILRELIERCWDDDPKKRPPLLDIISELKQIKHSDTWGSRLIALVRRR